MASSSHSDTGPSPRQIAMDLSPNPAYSLANFIPAPSNDSALRMIRAWPDWPAAAILLLGPDGTGKTHLGLAWAAQTGGLFIDDAHTASEDILFGEINAAIRGDRPGLLLASSRSPLDWNVTLPDLRSRLGAMPSVTLNEPNDDSLRPITRELFERRGRVVPDDVIDYLLRYTDRSIPNLKRTITLIDATAQSTRSDVTKAYVSKILRQSGELFDWD